MASNHIYIIDKNKIDFVYILLEACRDPTPAHFTDDNTVIPFLRTYAIFRAQGDHRRTEGGHVTHPGERAARRRRLPVRIERRQSLLAGAIRRQRYVCVCPR